MNLKKIILGLLDTAVKVAFVIVVAMLISKYSKIAYNYGYKIFNQKPVSSGTGRTVTVTISDGDSATKIAEKLATVGLITDKNLFVLQEKFSDYNGLEAPGTYELSTSMTPEEMLQIMASGSAEDSDSEDLGEEFGGLEPLEEISGDTSEGTSGD